MGFEGDGLQAKAGGIDIQILIGHKEEMILHGGPQAAQSGEDDGLLDLEHFLHFGEEVCEDAGGIGLRNTVGLGIEGSQEGVIALLGREIESPVGRHDGIAAVCEIGRNQFCNKAAHTGQGDNVVVHHHFFHHFGKEVNIHTSKAITDYRTKILKIMISFLMKIFNKKLWRIQKRLYLCNPVTQER